MYFIEVEAKWNSPFAASLEIENPTDALRVAEWLSKRADRACISCHARTPVMFQGSSIRLLSYETFYLVDEEGVPEEWTLLLEAAEEYLKTAHHLKVCRELDPNQVW